MEEVGSLAIREWELGPGPLCTGILAGFVSHRQLWTRRETAEKVPTDPWRLLKNSRVRRNVGLRRTEFNFCGQSVFHY